MVAGLLTFQAGSIPQACAAKTNKKMTAMEKLERDLKRGLEYKRMLVLEKLARIATQHARGLIIRTMLHDKSRPVRRAAQRLLAGVDDPRIGEVIIAGLTAEKRKVRLAAVDVAGLVREPIIANYLIASADTYVKDTELVLLIMESLREMVYRLEPLPGFEDKLHPFLLHRNRKVRETAVVILAILGRSASLPFLMEMWDKANRRLKIHLADAFANIGHVKPIELLLHGMEQRNTNLALHCMYAIAQIQSFSALPKIHTLLRRSKDPRIRMACLYAMVEIPDDSSIPVVLEIFNKDDPTTLHWATYTLSQLKATSAATQLMGKLDHPASLVRASAAIALGELKVKAAEPRLLEIITDGDETSEAQVAAARALISIGNTRGAEVLWQELQRTDLELLSRLTYALAVGAISDEKMQAEIALDLRSTKFTKSFTAALMLGVKGDPRARIPLVTALEHGYPHIRRYAILGLENIPDDTSYRILADTANDDPDPQVRILCAASLVRAGFRDFQVILWNSLETRKEDIRSEAIIALGSIADVQIIEQLKWYLRREPSIPVRQTIQRVLRENKL